MPLLKRHHSLALLLATLLAVAVGHATTACAQESTTNGALRLIASLGEISKGNLYALAATGADGQTYLMSHEATGKAGSEKLKGVEQTAELLTNAPDELLWTLQQHPDGTLSLLLPDGSQGIVAPEADGTNIVLKNGGATAWTASENGDGTFTLAHRDEPKRFLSLYTKAGGFFGNYTFYGSDTNRLLVYRLAQAPGTLPGEAVLPADGSHVIIGTIGHLAIPTSEDEMAATDIAPYLLPDGSIAPGLPAAEWTCRQNVDGSFVLLNAEEKFLTHRLTATTERSSWQIVRGRIATAETAETKCLVFDPAGRSFKLQSLEENAQTTSAIFLPLAAAPDSATTDGVKRLSGAWNAHKLGAVSWNGIHTLHLAAAQWPAAATEPGRRPADRHTLLYIREQDADNAPTHWQWLIGESDGGCRLLRKAALTDKLPLSIATPFNCERFELSYARRMKGDGGWETLCLPFACDVPESCEAEEFTACDGSTLNFRPVQTIEPNKPVIIRLRNADNRGETTVSFYSSAGSVSTENMEGATFAGTYSPLSVTTDEGDVYLLNAEGKAFVRAAAGSTLPPFRVAIRLESRAKTLHLNHGRPTALHHAAANPATIEIHTADGRRVGTTSPNGILKNLPRGVYIAGGKKFIK